jgi:uncharacterized protein (TIGR02147 family)
MLFRHDNYRDYLSETLSERIQLNPSYSLRLFALELSLSPSTVSEILKGKKNLSFGRATQVANKLGLDAGETAYFCTLVQFASAKGVDEKTQIQVRLSELNPKSKGVDLSLDIFAMISEWYHAPILALADITSFSFSARNVAKKLGITELQARVAIQRLVRLELLQKEGKGYKRLHDHLLFQSQEVNTALQKFHRQMLTRAIEVLTKQSNKEKFIGTRTFAFDPSQFPQVKRKIETFLTELMDLAERGEKKTEVYHLALTAFNLTGGSR